jgi:alpha-beta hydrolase superfamily lysophospholipase
MTGLAAQPRGRDEPLYFASGDHTLFAWLHRPASGTAGTLGLVICKPFGYEALCSHRSVRAFADAAAALGVPSLRFDYAGSGDSTDIDPNADQIDAWVLDVMAAMEELRRRTGVERICLMGIRLGAMLATLASARATDVAGLFLIAPVINGKRYLRELRTTRLAALLGADAAEGNRANGIEADSPGVMEFSGYPMSAATMAALEQIDLLKQQTPPVPDIVIVDRRDLSNAQAWYESLSKSGIQAQYFTLSGFVEMSLVAPQFAVIPKAMIATMCDHLLQLKQKVLMKRGSGPPPGVPDTMAMATTVLHLPRDDREDSSKLRERPVRFGVEALVFGIVTEPPCGEVRRRGVILLNTGADSHIGASRMNVSLARRWAKNGYVVLRMDLAGLGDSGTRAGRPDNEVFPPAAVDDIRAAVDLMRTEYGVGEITLSGLCSGAYHALRVAVADVPVSRILLVNPQTFFWSEGQTLEDIQLIEIVSSPRIYRGRARSVKHWKRLLMGQVDVWRIVQVNLRRIALTLESMGRDIARRIRIRLPHDLGRELEKIAARGVRVAFVFARDEPGIELLRIQGGSSVARLGDRCRVHVIESADHTFSRSGPRATMERILSDELFVRHDVPHSHETRV